MMTSPHFLVEGAIIAAYAIRARHAFIYVRGEVLLVLRRVQKAVAEAYEAGYLGDEHPRLGLRPRPGRPRRCRRLHLRRGDRAARLAGGPARTAAAASAVPRGRRPLRLPHRRQQRGVDRQRPADPAQRCGLVQVDGNREVPRLHAVLAVRACEPAGSVRGTTGHHAARTARVRRRRPGRPRAEVLDAGRVVDSAADRRTPRRTTGLRGHGVRRFDAGHQGAADLRRDHLRGARGPALDEFYAHESCGKCTPCREGTYWLAQIYERLETGRGTRRTSTSCSTSPTTSSESRSAPSATARPHRSCRRSSTSARSTRRIWASAARSTRTPRC